MTFFMCHGLSQPVIVIVPLTICVDVAVPRQKGTPPEGLHPQAAAPCESFHIRP